jgi:flagellar biosynthesis/type III secretory pathway protein FliH
MNSARLNLETFERHAVPRETYTSAVIEEFTRDPTPEPPKPDPEAERIAEAAALEAMLARARGEGRAEGFEQGAASAEAAFIAERRLILSDISERLADADLVRERTDAAVSNAIRALSESLILTAAPALARAGLAAEVAQAVAAAHAATHRDRGQPLVEVRAPADHLPAIRGALDEAGLQVTLCADPTLSALEARVIWGDGVDAIDLAACMAAAMQAIKVHFDSDGELRAHG